MKTFKIDESEVSFKIASNSYVYIDNLYVDEETRLQGVGSHLLNNVKLYARRKKMTIKLVATPQEKTTTTDDLISFYKKNGFKSSENQKNYMIWNY